MVSRIAISQLYHQWYARYVASLVMSRDYVLMQPGCDLSTKISSGNKWREK
jgi:hypothetical protein